MGDGQWASMARQEGGSNAGEDQTRKNGHWKHIPPNALAAAVIVGGAEDDALDLVVQTTACLKSVGLGVAGQVVEIGLEEPEGLSGARGEQAACV